MKLRVPSSANFDSQIYGSWPESRDKSLNLAVIRTEFHHSRIVALGESGLISIKEALREFQYQNCLKIYFHR